MIPASTLDELKVWMLSELPKHTILDDEVETLTEFIVALLVPDLSLEELKANCLSNLRDILDNDTDTVVNMVFDWLNTACAPAPKPKMSVSEKIASQRAAVADANAKATDTSSKQGLIPIEEPPRRRKINVVKRPTTENSSVPNQNVPSAEPTGPSASAQAHANAVYERTREREHAPKRRRDDESTNTALSVKNVPVDATDDVVKDFFSRFGPVAVTRMSPNLCKVQFETPDAAQKAFAAPEALCNNRFVRVLWWRDWAEPKRSRGQYGDDLHNVSAINMNAIPEPDRYTERMMMSEHKARQRQLQRNMRQQQHMQMHTMMKEHLHQMNTNPREEAGARPEGRREITMNESKEALRRNKQQLLSQLMSKRMAWAQTIIKGETTDGKPLDGPARAALKTKLDAASKQIDLLRKETVILDRNAATAARVNAEKAEKDGMNAAGQPRAAAVEAPVNSVSTESTPAPDAENDAQ